jgi:hypothetical protein
LIEKIEEFQLNDSWIRHGKSLIAKSGAKVLLLVTVNDVRKHYGENLSEEVCCAVLDRLAEEWSPDDGLWETLIRIVDEAKELIRQREAGEGG